MNRPKYRILDVDKSKTIISTNKLCFYNMTLCCLLQLVLRKIHNIKRNLNRISLLAEVFHKIVYLLQVKVRKSKTNQDFNRSRRLLKPKDFQNFRSKCFTSCQDNLTSSPSSRKWEWLVLDFTLNPSHQKLENQSTAILSWGGPWDIVIWHHPIKPAQVELRFGKINEKVSKTSHILQCDETCPHIS